VRTITENSEISKKYQPITGCPKCKGMPRRAQGPGDVYTHQCQQCGMLLMEQHDKETDTVFFTLIREGMK
jgi:hypothetical protein